MISWLNGIDVHHGHILNGYRVLPQDSVSENNAAIEEYGRNQ